MRSISPPESVHALDLDALRGPGIVFLALREGDETVAIGALKRPVGDDPTHGEIKSMHVAAARRGRGAARAMLGRLMDEARAAGLARLSLETGSTPSERDAPPSQPMALTAPTPAMARASRRDVARGDAARSLEVSREGERSAAHRLR